MMVQNKRSARVYELRIKNFMGAEVITINPETGKPVVLSGNNGQGKSSGIKGLYMALKGKKGLPYKFNNPVGPYSTNKVKKGEVSVGIESKGDQGVLELDGDNLKKFFVHFSITEKGTASLKVTDEETGKVHTSAPRDKIANLLGLFHDPLEVVRTLDDSFGDRKLAEKICAMVGLDLSPYVKRDEELSTQYTEANREYTRLKKALEGLVEPLDEWPREYTDPEKISNQIQAFNRFTRENERRKQVVEAVRLERVNEVKAGAKIDNEIISAKEQTASSENELHLEENKLNEQIQNLAIFEKEKKPEGWESSESANEIERQIAVLTERAKQYREYDKNILGATSSIEAKKERVSILSKTVDEKKQIEDNKEREKAEHIKILSDIDNRLAVTIEQNQPDKWDGEVDPEGKKEPLEYLESKMMKVTEMNENYYKRKAYEEAEEDVAVAEAEVKKIKNDKKENQTEKSKAVASVKEKFPHPGITVDENTVWVDLEDGKGKRSILDLSEGEKLMICTHILIAGNTGALDILIVRDGAILDRNSQKIIFDIAAEHDYTVILETIISTEKGALHIVDGKIDRVIGDDDGAELKEPTESLMDQKQREQAIGRGIRENTDEITW